MYIVLGSMYETMSISTGLYPNLDLWNTNKLHYITFTTVICFSCCQDAPVKSTACRTFVLSLMSFPLTIEQQLSVICAPCRTASNSSLSCNTLVLFGG